MQKEFDYNNEKMAEYLAEVCRILSLEKTNVPVFVVLLTKSDDPVS
jgi:hypothetical protein